MTAKAPKTQPPPSQNQLVLLPRDPDWAIAQWEINEQGVAQGIDRLSSFGGLVGLVLRIYTVGDDRRSRSRSPLREYPVEQWLGSQIVLLGCPGTVHQAVLGLRDESGTFSPLVRSAPVRSPSSRPLHLDEESAVRVPPPETPGTPLTCIPVTPGDDDPDRSSPVGREENRIEGEHT